MSELEYQPVKPEWIEGAVSVDSADAWFQPWRLPIDEHDLFNIDGGLSAASHTSGVRLRFRTASRQVTMEIEPGDGGAFDLVVDNTILQTVRLEEGAGEVAFDISQADLPDGPVVMELWLSQTRPVRIRTLGVEEGCALETAPDDRKRWVTYGSSITHCGAAHSPAQTWPGTAARLCDLHLTSLGFGGQCHIDGMVGKMIRDLPADVITLKLGINVQGGSTLGPRTFRPAIINLVRTIREGHPDIPIGVISPIISPPREKTPNAVGYTLELMREHLADAVERLRAAGDDRLVYFNGLDLFGPELLEFLPDDLHPDGEGYIRMGRNAAEKVLSRLLG